MSSRHTYVPIIIIILNMAFHHTEASFTRDKGQLMMIWHMQASQSHTHTCTVDMQVERHKLRQTNWGDSMDNTITTYIYTHTCMHTDPDTCPSTSQYIHIYIYRQLYIIYIHTFILIYMHAKVNVFMLTFISQFIYIKPCVHSSSHTVKEELIISKIRDCGNLNRDEKNDWMDEN